MEEITFVLYNFNMFAATGESEKPTFDLKLTDEQISIIKDKLKDYQILSIHPKLINKKDLHTGVYKPGMEQP